MTTADTPAKRSTPLQAFRRYLPYVHRPTLWPEMVRRAARRLSGIGEPHETDEREHAARWCRRLAITNDEAIGRMGLDPNSLSDLRSRFSREFAYADRKASECPMRLGGASNLDLLYALCEQIQARRVVETGVAYGWSSLAILLSLWARQDSALYSVDLPYFELHNDLWVGTVVPPALRASWTLFRMADREGLPRALRAAGVVDLVHYDSDKSSRGRRWAYPVIWSALRTSGVLMSDDVGDNLAFRDFCRDAGVQPMVVASGTKFAGVVVKH